MLRFIRIAFVLFSLFHMVWIIGRTQLSSRTAESEVRDTGLPPQHRSGGQCVPEHLARRLETRADCELDSVRPSVPVSGKDFAVRIPRIPRTVTN